MDISGGTVIANYMYSFSPGGKFMVYLPYLLKAAPAVASLLTSKQTHGKDSSAQQGSFANMLQSAVNIGSASAAPAAGSLANIKPDDIKSSANAVLDAIKKKIATPETYSMSPGIVNLPNAGNNNQVTLDSKKLSSANDAFNSAVAATPVKPLIETAPQSAQLNIGNNASIVVAAPNASQDTNTGLERYRMQSAALNRKSGNLGSGVMVGLRIPIG
jgi:hypothetical protein